MHRQFERAKELAHYRALPQADPDGSDDKDDDDEDFVSYGPCSTSRRQLYKMMPDVEGDNFNLVVGAVIVVNALVLGLETDLGNDQFLPFEHFFAMFFTLEMIMRISQLGIWGYLEKLSNCFDCLLVCTGDFDLWISGFFVSGKHKSSSAKLLKLLRMFRVMRIVRLFKMFHQLQIILEAFIKALSTVMWVGLLTLILNYICAVFLTQTVGHNADMWEEDDRQKIITWFGTIGNSLRTLFIILTLAEWDEIAMVCSEQINGLVVFSFAIAYITITAFTMVSLITGIISEELVGSQRDDEIFKLNQVEKTKKELFANVRELLEKCDDDGSGTLSPDEVKRALTDNDLKLVTKFQALDIHMEQDDFLELIDKVQSSCGSEEVPIDAVAHALEHLSGQATASSVWDLKMITQAGAKKAQSDSERILQQAEKIHEKVGDGVNILEKLDKLHEKVETVRNESRNGIDHVSRRLDKLEQNLEMDTCRTTSTVEELKRVISHKDDKLDKLMDLTVQLLDRQVKLEGDLKNISCRQFSPLNQEVRINGRCDEQPAEVSQGEQSILLEQ